MFFDSSSEVAVGSYRRDFKYAEGKPKFPDDPIYKGHEIRNNDNNKSSNINKDIK